MKSKQHVSDLRAQSGDQLNDELLNLKKEQSICAFSGPPGSSRTPPEFAS